VDFPPAFKLFNHWGDAFEILNANKLWTNLGETPDRKIVAQCIDPGKGLTYNTILEVNSISGNLEAYPMQSLEPFEKVFHDVTRLAHLTETAVFNRIGTRFLFLETCESFEQARAAFAAQIRPEYRDRFKGKLVDVSLVSVYEEEDQFTRLMAGPLSRDEFRNWFTQPDKITMDTGYFADVDCYTSKYKFKTFDLRKYIDFTYTSARKQTEDLIKYLKG